MLFHIDALRFRFLAREPVYFAPGQAANILRGAFGTIFRRLVCPLDCPGARQCPIRANCPYARLFEPSASAPGPSGLIDWPRPFVFRALHLDGQTIPAGAHFHFDLNLFDTQSEARTHLIRNFTEWAQAGIGPGRAKVELVSVEQLNQDHKPSATIALNDANAPSLAFDLSASGPPLSHLTIRFLTPTELKNAQQLAATPQFPILAVRIRDRLSTLRQFYGDGPLAIDFSAFTANAARIEMSRCEIRHIGRTRRSSRTGQVHPIGGFVGEAEYQGDLAEFLPYLNAAQWTGVGRQTVWGKGEFVLL